MTDRDVYFFGLGLAVCAALLGTLFGWLGRPRRTVADVFRELAELAEAGRLKLPDEGDDHE